MREHRYEFEMPHSAARIWALFQDYDRWTDYAPMVKRVDVLYPGDDDHNGRLRRVIYKMPFGREGSALELVTDVAARARLHVHDDLVDARQRPDRPRRARAARPEPHDVPLRRALQPPEGARSNGSRARSTSSSTRTTKTRCAARRRGSARTPSTAPISSRADDDADACEDLLGVVERGRSRRARSCADLCPRHRDGPAADRSLGAFVGTIAVFGIVVGGPVLLSASAPGHRELRRSGEDAEGVAGGVEHDVHAVLGLVVGEDRARGQGPPTEASTSSTSRSRCIVICGSPGCGGHTGRTKSGSCWNDNPVPPAGGLQPHPRTARRSTRSHPRRRW